MKEPALESNYAKNTMGYLARALKEVGNTEEANEVLHELIDIQTKQFGEDSQQVKNTRNLLTD